MKTKSSKLTAYLFASGALASGDKAVIAKAKQEYRKEYQKEFKRRRRKEIRECVVRFSHQEEMELMALAKTHKLNLPQFVRQTCLSYTHQVFLVPDIKTVYRIEACIVRMLTALEQIKNKEPKGLLLRSSRADEAFRIVEALKAELGLALKQPPSLDAAIQEKLTNDNAFKQRILNLLKS